MPFRLTGNYTICLMTFYIPRAFNREILIVSICFKTSPPEYLSECMRLLREGEIPYIDMELRNSLINFYSELAEAYNI